jgi:hypothetical protein
MVAIALRFSLDSLVRTLPVSGKLKVESFMGWCSSIVDSEFESLSLLPLLLFSESFFC